MQIPWGVEDGFVGVIDVIRQVAMRWGDETLGAEYEEVEVPEEFRAALEAARERVLEVASELDDQVLEKYLSGEEITPELLIEALRAGTVALKITPVFCGSAFKNKGVQPLLDAVIDYLPSPLDVGAIEGEHPDTGEAVEREPSDNAPFSGLVFKIMTDPFVGHLAFLRVYSGTVEAGSTALNIY